MDYDARRLREFLLKNVQTFLDIVHGSRDGMEVRLRVPTRNRVENTEIPRGHVHTMTLNGTNRRGGGGKLDLMIKLSPSGEVLNLHSAIAVWKRNQATSYSGWHAVQFLLDGQWIVANDLFPSQSRGDGAGSEGAHRILENRLAMVLRDQNPDYSPTDPIYTPTDPTFVVQRNTTANGNGNGNGNRNRNGNDSDSDSDSDSDNVNNPTRNVRRRREVEPAEAEAEAAPPADRRTGLGSQSIETSGPICGVCDTEDEKGHILDDGCYICLDCIPNSLKDMVEKHSQDGKPPRCPCYGETAKEHGAFTMSDAKWFDKEMGNELGAPIQQAIEEIYRKVNFQGSSWKCMHCNELSSRESDNAVLQCATCKGKSCVVCETRIIRGDEGHAQAHESNCRGIPKLEELTNEWQAIVERGNLSPSDIAKVSELLSVSALLRAAPKCPSCGIHFFKAASWECFHIICTCGKSFCFVCEGILDLDEPKYLELSGGGNKVVCLKYSKNKKESDSAEDTANRPGRPRAAVLDEELLPTPPEELDFVEHTANRPGRPRAAVLPELDKELCSRPPILGEKTESYYHFQVENSSTISKWTCPQYPSGLHPFFKGSLEPEKQLMIARVGHGLEKFLECPLNYSLKREIIAGMSDQLGIFEGNLEDDDKKAYDFEKAYDFFLEYRKSSK